MGFWIVVDGFNKKNDLPDDLADRFYGRLTKNYCKDNTGHDSFTVTHNGVKVFVIIQQKNTLDSTLALDDKVNQKGMFEVKLPWRANKKLDALQMRLDTEAGFWKIIEDIDAFFKKYSYVTLVKIYSE